jgi:hypothetical protein
MANFPKKPLLPLAGASKLSKPGHFAQDLAHKAQTALDQAKQREIEQVVQAYVRDLEMETNTAVNALKRRTQAGTRFQSSLEPRMDPGDKKSLAGMMQEQVEVQNEIIKMIMESKNQMVDAVMKMMNASFATIQKIQSAGMAR